jgi:hypothetical protein
MKFKGYEIKKVIKKCTFKGQPTDKYELYKVTGKGIKTPKYYVSMSDAKEFVKKFTETRLTQYQMAHLHMTIGRIERNMSKKYFGIK